MSTYQPPHNQPAESAMLASLMLEPKEVSRIREIVRADDLWSEPHRAIYRSILRLDEKYPSGYDTVTLITDLQDHGDLEKAGGSQGVTKTLGSTFSALMLDTYVQQIAACARARRMQVEMSKSIARLSDRSTDVDEEALRITEEMQQTIKTRPGKQGVTMPQAIREWSAWFKSVLDSEAPPCRATGIDYLDKAIDGGLYDGRAYYVAALKKQGKTKFVTAMVLGVIREHRTQLRSLYRRKSIEANQAGEPFPVEMEDFIAQHDYAIDWYTAEMTERQMTTRFLSCLMRYPEHQLANPSKYVADDDVSFYQRLLDAQHALKKVDQEFYGGVPRLSDIIVNTRNRISRLGHNRLILVVDYLQLVDGGNKGEQKERMDSADSSRKLSGLVKELGCIGVFVAHFNRTAESRDFPRSSDLLNSGQLEKDVDHLLILHRPDWESSGPEARRMVVVHDLNRHGERNRCELEADLEKNQFGPWYGPGGR